MFTYTFKDLGPLSAMFSLLRCDEQVDLHFSRDGISFRNYLLGGSIGLVLFLKAGSFLTDIQCNTDETVVLALDTKSTYSAIDTIIKTPRTELYRLLCTENSIILMALRDKIGTVAARTTIKPVCQKSTLLSETDSFPNNLNDPMNPFEFDFKTNIIHTSLTEIM
jgi:hypothetical protein